MSLLFLMYVFLKFEVKHNSHLAIHDVTLRFLLPRFVRPRSKGGGNHWISLVCQILCLLFTFDTHYTRYVCHNCDKYLTRCAREEKGLMWPLVWKYNLLAVRKAWCRSDYSCGWGASSRLARTAEWGIVPPFWPSAFSSAQIPSHRTVLSYS